MELTALRTFRFGNTNVRRGAKVTMSDARGKEHIDRGFASEVKPERKSEPKPEPKPKGESKKAD